MDSPGMLTQLRRIFPLYEIARVPAASCGEWAPTPQMPAGFQCDHARHVVAGPPQELERNEFQKRARRIANDPTVTLVPTEPAPQ